MTAESNCTETLAELQRFLDRELPPEKVAVVMSHLEGCTDCQSAFEFHTELVRVVRVHAQDDDLDPGFADRLRSFLSADPGTDPGTSRG